MSEDTQPTRFIAGPPPIRKATSLNRETRAASLGQDSERTAVSPDVSLPASPSSADPVPPVMLPEEVPPVRTLNDRAGGQSKARITFDIPKDLRLRVRAMFKETRGAEDDASFAGMLCTIIERECLRREHIYNGGVPFADNDKPLPVGRPLL